MDPFDFHRRLESLRARLIKAGSTAGQRDDDAPETRASQLLSQSSAPRRHRRTAVQALGVWNERLSRLRNHLGTGKVLALLGPRHAGKTQLAVELMRDQTKLGRSALYRTATELFQMFKDSFRDEAENSAERLLADHRRPAFLVIDEINTPHASEWQRLLLFEVVNRRYGDLKDTLLVSPLSQAQFIAAVGDPVLARIRKAGVLVALEESSGGERTRDEFTPPPTR